MTKSMGRALGVAAVLTALGCSGSEKGSGPTPSIGVTATPSALTVQQGTSGTVSVALTRGGGFSAAVNVSVTGLPTGVTVDVAPAQLTGAVSSATVTVTVPASVAAGTYTATIHAAAAGVGEATTTYQLTVTATPNFSLTATPAAVTIPAGTSGTSTIGVVRTNFTGAVALTLDAPPAGITGVFNPASATADQSVLTVSVAPSVVTGNYNLTVKGAATGPGEKTTTVTLTVSQQPDYTLTATPNALNINAGENSTTTVNIARTNFTGAITLALDAPPAGITATFNPAAPTATSSVATIAIAPTVTPGPYTLTIKGTASGVPTVVDSGAASVEMVAPGDRTTTVTVTVLPVPDFTIAASPNAISVAQAGTGNSTIDLVRTNLALDIGLSLVSPPNGITGAFTPTTVPTASTSSALVISVAGSVATGVYPVTVQGAAGSLTKTTIVTVTVVSGPTVSLIAGPATLSIEQGASATSTLTATRVNFSGNIVPSASGQPGGMSVAFNPNPLTANTSTITVTVGSGVAVGQYNLTITGAAGAAGNPTTPLQVNVTAATGSSVSWQFCDLAESPLKFWRQSNGVWSEVTPSVVGNTTTFTFTIAGTSGGVAYTLNPQDAVRRNASRAPVAALATAQHAREQVASVRGRNGMRLTSTIRTGSFSTTVLFASVAELQGGLAGLCTTEPATVQKTFNPIGQIAGEEGYFGYNGYPFGFNFSTATFNASVAPGTYDWLAIYGPLPTLPTITHHWQNYNIGRAEAAPGAPVTINRGTAGTLTQFPFVVSGGLGVSNYALSEFVSGARGSMGGFQLDSPFNTTGTGNMFFIPPVDRLPTDMHALGIQNYTTTSNLTRVLLQTNYFGSAPPGSGTVSMGQEVPAFVVSQVGGAPVTTWSVSGATPAHYQGTASQISATFTGAGSNTTYTLTATRSWLNANGFVSNYTLAGPDLPGFDPLWAAPAPLSQTSVIMIGPNFTSAPVAGSISRIASRTQIP